MASNTKVGITIEAKDNATSSLRNIQSSLGDLQNKAMDASKNFALGLGAVAAAGAGVASMAIKAASDAEQAQTAFTTMLGSAEKAQTFIADMKSFAAKTPFETTDISKAAQTMLSFGMDAKSVMPNIQMLGDVAMGDAQKFASLSLVFSQVQASGKLMGGDLLQMVGQGFNPLTIMAKTTGKSISELKDEMEKGAISSDMVTQAFKDATSAGGIFYGGMEAQSTTFAGTMSTLSDTFNEQMRILGEKLLPTAKELVAVASGFVQNTLPVWIQKTQDLTTWFMQHKEAIYIVSGAIMGALIPTVYGLITAFAAMTITLAPYMIAGAIIAGIVAGILWVRDNWDTLRDKAIETWGAIKDYISNKSTEIQNAVQTVFEGIYTYITESWQKIRDSIINKVAEIKQAILDFAQQHQVVAGMVVGAISAMIAGGFVLLVNYIRTSVIPAIISFATTLVTETIPALAKMALEMTVNSIKAMGSFVLTILTETIPALVKLAIEITVSTIKAIASFTLSITGAAIGALVAFATAIWTTVLPAIAAFSVALLSNPLFALVALGVAIGGLVALIISNWGTITSATQSMGAGIKSAVDGVWNWINSSLKVSSALILNGIKAFTDSFKAYFTDVRDYIVGVMNNLYSQISNIVQRIKSTMSEVKSAWSNAGSNISWALSGARAAGGPVSGGASYLVGEAGPEIFTPGGSGFITPNNRMGGGTTIINVYGTDLSADRCEYVGDMIARKLSLQLKN